MNQSSNSVQHLVQALNQVENLLNELQQLDATVEQKIEDQSWMDYYFSPWENVKSLWSNLAVEEQTNVELITQLKKISLKQQQVLDVVKNHQSIMGVELEKFALSRPGLQAYNDNAL